MGAFSIWHMIALFVLGVILLPLATVAVAFVLAF